MLRLVTVLVRSRLDYGSAVYGQTSPRYLRLLDPIQNEGLRIALGVFRSSPKESLEVEAGGNGPVSTEGTTYVLLVSPDTDPQALCFDSSNRKGSS